MPRGGLRDKLQTHAFYLMDVAPIEALGLPIFSPIFGFSSISAPIIELETQEINEGNWPWPTSVIKRARISPITMQRGATFFDSDFWRWINAAAYGDVERLQSRMYGVATALAQGGNATAVAIGAVAGLAGGLFGFPRIGGPTYRRNLLLVQCFSVPIDEDSWIAPLIQGTLTTAMGVGLFGGGSPLNAAVTVGTELLGISEYLRRLPARAWMLKGCVPTSYKVSGDFDASQSEIALMEVTVALSEIEEISLAA